MNRTGAVADRRLTESSTPRRHIAGRSDADAASAAAEPERPFPRQRTSLYDATAALRARKELAKSGGDQATHRQRALGKMTARERVDALLDDGSFVEIGLLARHRAAGFGLERNRPDTDGVVTGWGTVDGRKVFVYAHDFRIFGGSLGEVFATKIHTLMDLAAATGAPVIGLNDGGGARIQEGITALAGFGGIFARNVSLSGVVPQISVILGPCAGGAAYSPALTDFVFSVKDKTNLFITGPDVVEAVTGEATTREELGGAVTHATRTGVATFLVDDESSCFDEIRYLLSFLPSNNHEDPPYFVPTDQPSRRCDELLDIVPAEPNRVYDVRDVIEVIVDDGDYLEVQPLWANEHRMRLRAPRWSRSGDSGESAARPRRRTEHRRSGEGRPVRPHLRLVQHPPRDTCGCPGISPRYRPGARRNHPPRREAALRLLRVNRASGPGGPAQGVRRRLHRHGLEVSGGRLVVRLAVQRDSRDGRRGRGQHHLPQGAGRSAGPDATSKGAGGGVHRAADDAIHRRGTRDGRRRDRPR